MFLGFQVYSLQRGLDPSSRFAGRGGVTDCDTPRYGNIDRNSLHAFDISIRGLKRPFAFHINNFSKAHKGKG